MIQFNYTYFWLCALTLFFSCGGSLSDEQRKKFKEGMEQQKIVKVSDAKIMTTAMERGQAISKALQQVQFRKAGIDSIEQHYKVNIRWVVPGTTNALAIEQELIDAYINGLVTGATHDNLQKLWTTPQKNEYDSLVYTQPKLTKRADGVEALEGIWNVYMAKKDVVLSFAKQH